MRPLPHLAPVRSIRAQTYDGETPCQDGDWPRARRVDPCGGALAGWAAPGRGRPISSQSAPAPDAAVGGWPCGPSGLDQGARHHSAPDRHATPHRRPATHRGRAPLARCSVGRPARVPVIVKEAAPQEMLELALVENVQRADLNPLEEALAYQHLVADFGLSQSEVARRVGKSRPAVSNVMRLLDAAPRSNRPSWMRDLRGARASVAGTGDPRGAGRGAADCAGKSFNVRDTEALVRRLRGMRGPGRPGEARAGPYIHALESASRPPLELASASSTARNRGAS